MRKALLLVTMVLGFLVNSSLAFALDVNKITDLVNQSRLRVGKPLLVPHDQICEIAQNRAPAVSKEIYQGYMHAGFHNLKLPYWATEVVIDMRTDEAAVNWWLNSWVHRSIILGDYRYGCIRCSGEACAGIFTDFTPK